MTGLEPATPGATIQCSTTELHPPHTEKPVPESDAHEERPLGARHVAHPTRPAQGSTPWKWHRSAESEPCPPSAGPYCCPEETFEGRRRRTRNCSGKRILIFRPLSAFRYSRKGHARRDPSHPDPDWGCSIAVRRRLRKRPGTGPRPGALPRLQASPGRHSSRRKRKELSRGCGRHRSLYPAV
jgi:hypothetical protein